MERAGATGAAPAFKRAMRNRGYAIIALNRSTTTDFACFTRLMPVFLFKSSILRKNRRVESYAASESSPISRVGGGGGGGGGHLLQNNQHHRATEAAHECRDRRHARACVAEWQHKRQHSHKRHYHEINPQYLPQVLSNAEAAQ